MSTKIDLFKIDHNILEKAANKFDKTEKCLENDVNVLQEWLETQPHLPKLLDSHSLRNFLLLNKCSIEETKEKIDNYYTSRSKVPEIFKEINPKLSYNEEFDEIVYLVAHPQRNEKMHRIYFFKLKNPNLVEKFEATRVIKQLVTMKEMRLREDVTCGNVFVVDCEGLTLSAVLKFTPTLVYKGIILIYKGMFSLRVKGLYFINFPSFAESVLNLMKSFITPKVRKRIYICANLDSLTKFVPLEILPKEFGGEGLSLEILQEALKTKRLEYQNLFDRLDEAIVDETLRPEKLENDAFLGFHGNFRKLNFD